METLGLIVYRSTAVFPPKDISNLDILREALERNRDLGITGYLIRQGPCFLQAIEGAVANVDRLMQGILRDRRHHSVETLCRCETDRRLFTEWSMGYFGTLAETETGIMDLNPSEALARLEETAWRQLEKRQSVALNPNGPDHPNDGPARPGDAMSGDTGAG